MHIQQRAQQTRPLASLLCPLSSALVLCPLSSLLYLHPSFRLPTLRYVLSTSPSSFVLCSVLSPLFLFIIICYYLLSTIKHHSLQQMMMRKKTKKQQQPFSSYRFSSFLFFTSSFFSFIIFLSKFKNTPTPYEEGIVPSSFEG